MLPIARGVKPSHVAPRKENGIRTDNATRIQRRCLQPTDRAGSSQITVSNLIANDPALHECAIRVLVERFINF